MNLESNDEEEVVVTKEVKEVTKPKGNKPTGPQTKTDEGKTHFQLGDIDIAVPHSKAHLLGIMGSSLILFTAILVEDPLDFAPGYRVYGIILSIVAFVIALVSFILPSENKLTKTIKFLNFVWTLVGACVLTFGKGPFPDTGNGYFAVWSTVIFSSLASDPIGTINTQFALDKVNALFDFGASAAVLVVALAVEIIENKVTSYDRYKFECIFSMIVACISVLTVIIMSWSVFAKDKHFKGEIVILGVLTVLWIIAACALTFSGPFNQTNNGYFASWLGLLTSARAVSYSWKNSNS